MELGIISQKGAAELALIHGIALHEAGTGITPAQLSSHSTPLDKGITEKRATPCTLVMGWSQSLQQTALY